MNASTGHGMSSKITLRQYNTETANNQTNFPAIAARQALNRGKLAGYALTFHNVTHLILPTKAEDLLPQRAGDQLTWRGLNGSAHLARASSQPSCANKHRADTPIDRPCHGRARGTEEWASGIRFFQSSAEPHQILRFPDWETLPYDAFSPHQDITSERLACLQNLRNGQQGLLIVPAPTLVQKIAPTSFLDGACFDLRRGQIFDTESERLRLEAAGYRATDTVTERGQYAVRGAVMDIFPMGAELPVRIDLFDEEIDTLRTFDPDSQLSVSADQ